MLTLTILIMMNSCVYSQKLTIDVQPCKRINIKAFEENAIKEGAHKFYRYNTKDGLKIVQIKMDKYYDETIEQEGTPLKKRRFYDIATGIISECDLFYSCPVGTIKQYDESGKLAKEADAEEDMKFKVTDVIKMVKKEFDIDLTKPRHYMHMSRGDDYIVRFGSDTPLPLRSEVESIMPDGTTGEIYFHAKDGKAAINSRNIEYPIVLTL
ncbi:MAG: hypothetical protein LBG19_10865 [Prevotellaceae bacterium]|nr:hypothetical protein [Prevotellaceae bacterium]